MKIMGAILLLSLPIVLSVEHLQAAPSVLPGSASIRDPVFRVANPRPHAVQSHEGGNKILSVPLTDRRLTIAQKAQPLGGDLIDAILRIEGMFDPTRIGLFGRALRMEVRAGVASMENVFGDRWRLVTDDPNVHYRVKYLAQAWLWAPEATCDRFWRYRPDDSTIIFNTMTSDDCFRLKSYDRNAGRFPKIAGGPLNLPIFAAPYAGGRLSLEDLRAALKARIRAIEQRLLLKTRWGSAINQSRTPPLRAGGVEP